MKMYVGRIRNTITGWERTTGPTTRRDAAQYAARSLADNQSRSVSRKESNEWFTSLLSGERAHVAVGKYAAFVEPEEEA